MHEINPHPASHSTLALRIGQPAGLTVAHVDKNAKPPHALRGDKLDFPNLCRLRILNCREFDLTNVALNDWSFIAKRGIEAQYDWEYTRIPKTHGCVAGAILSRMFKWRLQKSDAGKKAIFDNLKTNRQFRKHIDTAFGSHWVPPILDDPGFRTADDLHDFVFKEEKTADLSRAVAQVHHGFFTTYAGNLARKFDCRDCDVEMTGAGFPKAQIRGAQAEAPLCYYCQYEQKLYTVTEATSSQVTAVPLNYETRETMSPLSLRQVVRRALNMQERPIIQQPLNTLFNETCPLSLKGVVCPHMKKKGCGLKESYRSNSRALQDLKTPSPHLIKTCLDKMQTWVCSTGHTEDERKKCRFGHDFWEERTFLSQEDVEEYHTK